MKRILTLLVILLSISLNGFSKSVDENTAKLVGQHYIQTHTNSAVLKNVSQLVLVYKETSKASNASAYQEPLVYFYVFNTVDAKGFVIVSADDNASPVLGYSDESIFKSTDIPINVAKWLEGYKEQMRYIIKNNIAATVEISNSWKSLMDGSATITSRGSRSISPLLKCTWDQSPYYNAQCPYDNASSQRTVTGCVATAMAQVMKYHSYPANGNGFHSYSSQNYGNLSASFGSTKYDWSSMPNNVTSANSAVATLMYHCGVSVDMNYGIASAGGSGAYVISSGSPVTNCAEYALKTYFGYSTSLKGVDRSKYSDANWLALIENELNNSRPIIYAGFGSGGGHCFVADGFDASDKIHFNWGWSGYYNGYFSIDALNPTGTGTGGGTGGFNSGHQAIIGITPATSVSHNSKDSLSLYDNVNVSSATIYYQQSFDVTTNVYNPGKDDFKGDYCAAIFDANDNFVTIIDSFINVSLPSGKVYSSNIKFSCKGLLSMLPGSYTVSIFYRYSDGDWILLSDYNSYTNSADIQVINPNKIALYAAMKITGTGIFVKGKAGSVTLDLSNSGTTTFTGSVNLSLFNLDGTFATTIEQKNSLSLGAGNHFSGGLTFSSTNINVAPGSYYMALEHQKSGGSWELTGSDNYQNPIKITVQAAPLLPDKYEVNNTAAQAYKLPLTFVGGEATATTVGSNCHLGSDYDYYKLDLPSGYSYTISSKIQDAVYNDNGILYTLDAIASYSIDGGNSWSDTYDDLVDDVVMPNGGTIYYLLAPHFTGNVGTYEFDLDVIRGKNSGIMQETNIDNINIYPNPASGFINIDLSAYSGKVTAIYLSNLQGQQIIANTNIAGKGTHQLLLDNISSGVYFLQLHSTDGILTKKIVVNK